MHAIAVADSVPARGRRVWTPDVRRPEKRFVSTPWDLTGTVGRPTYLTRVEVTRIRTAEPAPAKNSLALLEADSQSLKEVVVLLAGRCSTARGGFAKILYHLLRDV